MEQKSVVVDVIEPIEPILSDENDMVTLSPVQAQRLYDFSMMGDIEGVFAEINHLQQIAELTTLAKQLCQLADDFKLEQVCEIVKPYIK